MSAYQEDFLRGQKPTAIRGRPVLADVLHRETAREMPTTNDTFAIAEAEDGTAAVLVHVLLNNLGVIGSASRTLLERWDQLPGDTREELLTLIYEGVREGIERLQLLYYALPDEPDSEAV